MNLDLGIWLGIISVVLGILSLIGYKVYKSSSSSNNLKHNRVNRDVNFIQNNELKDSDIVLGNKEVNNHYSSMSEKGTKIND